MDVGFEVVMSLGGDVTVGGSLGTSQQGKSWAELLEELLEELFEELFEERPRLTLLHGRHLQQGKWVDLLEEEEESLP